VPAEDVGEWDMCMLGRHCDYWYEDCSCNRIIIFVWNFASLLFCLYRRLS
jgi:hypothetical protein